MVSVFFFLITAVIRRHLWEPVCELELGKEQTPSQHTGFLLLGSYLGAFEMHPKSFSSQMFGFPN